MRPCIGGRHHSLAHDCWCGPAPAYGQRWCGRILKAPDLSLDPTSSHKIIPGRHLLQLPLKLSPHLVFKRTSQLNRLVRTRDNLDSYEAVLRPVATVSTWTLQH